MPIEIPADERAFIRSRFRSLIEERCRILGMSREELPHILPLSVEKLYGSEMLLLSYQEFKDMCRIFWPDIKPHEVYGLLLPPNPSYQLLLVYHTMGGLEDGEFS